MALCCQAKKHIPAPFTLCEVLMIFTTRLVLASTFLLGVSTLNSSASAEAIRVNSTCEIGDCPSPGVLAIGTSLSTPFDFTYTFGNTDAYRLQGNLSTTNQPTTFLLEITDFEVTYEGNASGSASSTDVLASDFLQGIDSAQAYGAGFESIGGVFGPGLGSASSASGQVSFAGNSLPILGPFTPPPALFSGLYQGPITIPRGNILLDYQYTLTFGSGSEIGASIEVNPTQPAGVTPEPATWTLLGSGLLGLARLLRRHSTQLSCRY
jgi:hypothetical protein